MTYLENILSLESKTNVTPKQTLILYIDKGINPYIKANNLIASLESKDIQVVINEGTKLGETVMYTGQLDNNAVVDGVYYEELDTNLPNARHVKLITASSKNEIPSHVQHIYLDETDEGLDEVFNTVSFESKSNIKLHRTPESILKEYGVEGLLTTGLLVGAAVLLIKKMLTKKVDKPKEAPKGTIDTVRQQMEKLIPIVTNPVYNERTLLTDNKFKALVVGKKGLDSDPIKQGKLIESTVKHNSAQFKIVNTATSANESIIRRILPKLPANDTGDALAIKIDESVKELSSNWGKLEKAYENVVPLGGDFESYSINATNRSNEAKPVESVAAKNTPKIELYTITTEAELNAVLTAYAALFEQFYSSFPSAITFQQVFANMPTSIQQGLSEAIETGALDTLRKYGNDEYYMDVYYDPIEHTHKQYEKAMRAMYAWVMASIKH